MDKKNCGNCAHSYYPPVNVKPMSGAGGTMKICGKPRKRKPKGVEFVAPECKCKDWLRQPSGEETK